VVIKVKLSGLYIEASIDWVWPPGYLNYNQAHGHTAYMNQGLTADLKAGVKLSSALQVRPFKEISFHDNILGPIQTHSV
jgi:hypothetical protein